MYHKYYYLSGNSILEIMLAIFISSIGVYSVFILSLKSITNINTSNQYLHASYAVEDMANRIQANPDIAKNTNAYVTSKILINSSDCQENSDIDYCQQQLCSATDVANYDIDNWKQMLACKLNNVTAEIIAIETDTIKKYEIIIEFNVTDNKSNEDATKVKISAYQSL